MTEEEFKEYLELRRCKKRNEWISAIVSIASYIVGVIIGILIILKVMQ